MDDDEDVVVEEIPNTIVLIVIIHQILKKRKASLYHQKWNNTEVKQENGKCLQDKPPKNHENNCYIYGMKGYWSRTCCTPKHLVDLYQTSIKGKEVEINFIDSDGQAVLTQLDVSNFFENLNGKIDHLIGDGNVCYD